jgi:hypothetical protein
MATRFLRPCGAAGAAACAGAAVGAGAAAGAGAAGFAWAFDAGAATKRLKAKTRADHTSFFMIDLTVGTVFSRDKIPQSEMNVTGLQLRVSILVSALLRLYNVEEPADSMSPSQAWQEKLHVQKAQVIELWNLRVGQPIGAPIPEKQRGTPKHPSFWQKLLPRVAALLELEAYRQLCFTRIAHALPDEPVEIKQWRTAAADCVDVVFVIEQVEDLHLGDDLEPLSKVKWSCRSEVKRKVAVILAKEVPSAIDVRSA